MAALTLHKVGESLSGLMRGIVLHRLRCAVRILEQAPLETPTSHMARVCLRPEMLHLLERFDSFHHIPLGLPSILIQSLDCQGKARPSLRAGRFMFSWEALYYRLSANFDEFANNYIPSPHTAVHYTDNIAESVKSKAVYKTLLELLLYDIWRQGKFE